MGYSIELRCISIQDYKELLLSQNLLPGRRILLENIEDNFKVISDYGITNIYELKNMLSTPIKIKFFSEKTNISEDYLKILKRELSSLEQKPVQIKDIPDIDEEIVERLSRNGIKTSKDYYERYILGDEKLPIWDVLFSLCDLVRINGIGVAAARTFYEAGYSTASAVSNAKAEDMLIRVNKVNETRQYYKARLGVKDMQFCIDFAKLLSRYDNNVL